MPLAFSDARESIRPTVGVALIGLRGSGKSTVGRLLAGRLGLRFVDLDERTPRFAGATSVAEVFAKQGEAGFRAAEGRALEAALREMPCVLALGGGTPTAPGAAEALRRAARTGELAIVYLRADAAALRARMARDDNSHRPSLTGKDPLDEVEDVLSARDAPYRALATHVVEVASSDARQVAAFIAAKLD